MTKAKFFKTTIAIEVLSEDPIPQGMELESIIQEAITGSYSMRPLKHVQKEINGRQAAQALLKQGSDPSFFSLDEKGNDLR